MTHAAFRRALRVFCRRVPFSPFRVELVTGENLVIRHPEAVVVRGDLAYYRQPDRLQRMFDGASVCQLSDIPVEPSR